MKAVALVASLMTGAFGLSWDHEFTSELLEKESMHALFQAWRFAHGKVYDTIDEELHRFSIFEGNLARIAASNDDYFNQDSEVSYRLRMNHFGDLTDKEFHDTYNCPVKPTTVEEESISRGSSSSSDESSSSSSVLGGDDADLRNLASSMDWTSAGYVTPVKNQGQCGSCWSFSATGAMECDYAIKHGKSSLISLSEQQLVDCSGSYGNQGCNGGWYYDAWKYAEHEGGLCTEKEYPYKAVQGSCKASSCGTKYDKPVGYSAVKADSESSLASAVNSGCVSVAIQANQFAFQYYSGGVLTGTCGTRLDHAVLVTGYGTLSGQGYWLVKNSWGSGWGENGYVYICKGCGANGSKGECGIDMQPYIPKF